MTPPYPADAMATGDLAESRPRMNIQRTRRLLGLACLAPWAAHAAPLPRPPDLAAITREVLELEQAFAHTMRDRDAAAFATYIADEAIFFTGRQVLRGKAAVLLGWQPFFEGAKPTFSWNAETAEPLATGDLVLSSGPVRDAEGRWVSRFNSIWRRGPDGRWQVVFDKGCRCTDSAG